MTDTPKRLTGPAAVPTSSATQYTVPGSTTTILRHLHVVNTTAGELAFTAGVGADAAATRLFSALPIPANGVLDWSGFLVLAAAETLRAHGSGSGLTLTCSGVEVS